MQWLSYCLTHERLMLVLAASKSREIYVEHKLREAFQSL